MNAVIPPTLITRAELMKLLRVGSTALWLVEKSSDPPPRIRVGGSIRYDLDQVKAWLARRQQSASGKAA